MLLYGTAEASAWTTKRDNPDEWAANHRVYGPETGRPGRRDPKLTPYVIPFIRAHGDPRYRRNVFVTSAQSGKTEGFLDIIGERLDNRPAPILYVGPSKEFVTDQFEPRLVDLFRQAKTLTPKVLGGVDGKRQKKTLKRVAGVRVRLAHAGSSTALKSDPAAFGLVDEYDEMLANVKGQGDPLGLIEHRGDTYADFSVSVASTPSKGTPDVEKDPATGLEFWKEVPVEDVQSPIWRLWQEGTRYHWAWPCPQCADYFIPRFSCLRWKGSGDRGAKTTPADAKRTAFVECPRCGGVIREAEKAGMNERGVFVAPGQSIAKDGRVVGDPPDSSTVSWWVSGLASPFVTFGQRAEDFLKAVRSGEQDKIQTAVNAGFGELFTSGGGDAPEWSEVKEHRAEYGKGEAPAEVVFVTLTADVQKTRILWTTRGWGPRATSWLIDWGVLHGETVEEPIWTDFADLIQQPVCGMPLKLVLVDSGFRPGKTDEIPLNRVYDFCRRFPRLVRPTKGSSAPMRVPLITSKIEVRTTGKAAKYGLDLVRLDTDHWKSWVHERVRWPMGQPGAWYLPHDISDDYCAQIVSEARVKRPSGRHQWIRRSKENHYLDCEAMQAAAAHLLNAQRLSPEIVAQMRAQREQEARVVDVVKVTQQQPGPRAETPSSSWLDTTGGWL